MSMTEQQIREIARRFADNAIKALQKKHPDIEPEFIEPLRGDIEAWYIFRPIKESSIRMGLLDCIEDTEIKIVIESYEWYKEIKSGRRSGEFDTWENNYTKMIQDGCSPFLIYKLMHKITTVYKDVNAPYSGYYKEVRDELKYILDKLSNDPEELYERLIKELKWIYKHCRFPIFHLWDTELEDIILNRTMSSIYRNCFCTK